MFNFIALAVLVLIISILYDRYIQKYNQSTELEYMNVSSTIY